MFPDGSRPPSLATFHLTRKRRARLIRFHLDAPAKLTVKTKVTTCKTLRIFPESQRCAFHPERLCSLSRSRPLALALLYPGPVWRQSVLWHGSVFFAYRLLPKTPAPQSPPDHKPRFAVFVKFRARGLKWSNRAQLVRLSFASPSDRPPTSSARPVLGILEARSWRIIVAEKLRGCLVAAAAPDATSSSN